MKKLILALLLIFITTGLNAKKFVVGIDSWAPFVYFENNEPKGLTIDIFKKLAKKLNYDIEFIHIPWSRSLQMMKDGEIDAMGNLSFSKERAEFIEYAQPLYYKLQTLFYTLKENKDVVKEYEDLYKHTILVGKDYVYYPKFDNDKNIKKEILIDRNTDKNTTIAEEVMLKMLIKKRIEVIISANAIMDYCIAKNENENLISISKYKPLDSDFQYIGISKKSPFIKDIDKINEAMKKILNK